MTQLIVPLVGTHFQGNEAKATLRALPGGSTGFTLRPEPENKFDPKAIAVDWTSDNGITICLGHVGATGGKPCQTMGLSGTKEVHAMCGEGLYTPELMEGISISLDWCEDKPTLMIDDGDK